MSGLTEEQRRRIEENKRKALAKRAAKQNTGFSPIKQGSGGAGNFSAPGAALNRATAPGGSYSKPQTGSFTGNVNNNNNQSYSTGYNTRPSGPAFPSGSQLRPPGPTFSTGNQARLTGSQPSPSGQSVTAGNQVRPLNQSHIQVRAQSQSYPTGALSNQGRAPGSAPGPPSSATRPPGSASRPPTSPQIHAINRQSGSQVNPTQTNSFYGSAPTSSSNYRPTTSGQSTYAGAGANRFNQSKNFQQNQGPSFQQRQGQGFSKGATSSKAVSPNKVVTQIFNEASKASAKTKGTCVLVQRTRFEVQVGYHAKLIEVFKSMPTRQYNSENRRWSFHLKEYQALMVKVGDLREDVYLDGLPRSVLQVIRLL